MENYYFFKKNVIDFREREMEGGWVGGKGRGRSTDLLFYLFMYSWVDSFLFPEPGIEPTTLVYQDNALSDGATRPGQESLFNATEF